MHHADGGDGIAEEVGHTGVMRVYIPATATDLAADVLTARLAHAVTADLMQALPDEDEEGWEVSACLCAADSSLMRLAESEHVNEADRRLVIAADVDTGVVRNRAGDDECVPGTVELTTEVPWCDVAAILVDEESVEEDVRLARAGDEGAFERAADADLLWYDVTERAHLHAELTSVKPV